MSTSFCRLTMGLGSAALLSLVSCQENTPIAPDAAPSEVTTNDLIVSVPKHYTLTKWGIDNLTYYADGRLKRVVHGADIRGAVAVRTDYTYAPGSIHALSFVGNSPLWDQTYLIDEPTGRCKAYTGLRYLYSNSSATEKTDLTYTYDATGRLKTSNDKANPAIRTEYVYNAAGDLSRVTDYAMNYNAFAIYVKSDYKFAYDQPVGDPILADLHPLNHELAIPPDPYLPIFGKQTKHLVKLITSALDLSGRYYTYKLNADGYVTERSEYALQGAALIETKPYAYLVTTLSVAP